MVVRHEHGCSDRAGDMGKLAVVGECWRRLGEYQLGFVDGRSERKLNAATECWIDGLDQRERVRWEARANRSQRVQPSGLEQMRADYVGVGHICEMPGGIRAGREQSRGYERCRSSWKRKCGLLYG